MFLRPVIAGVLGAVFGAVALTVAHLISPGLSFEMDAAFPPFISGIYSGERDGATTFAWTTGQVVVNLPELDHHRPWTCILRFRGPRPDGAAPPTVGVTVNDARVASVPAAAEFHDLGFTIPAGSGGVRLAIDAAPTFTPGTNDKRVLGVQIDRLFCKPTAMAWPPREALAQTAGATGFLAAIFVFAGFSLPGALLCAAATAAGAAMMLTTAAGLYTSYGNTILRLTLWISAITGLVVAVGNRAGKSRLSAEARAALAITAVALLIKLFGLMHPAKPVIDAVFHAHRLDDVIGGRRFFSQPIGDVQMPYGIGLYVFAWPWTWLVSDHVALIRTVTAVSDALAGLLLYPVIVRAWNDRRTAVLATLFYQVSLLGLVVLGNANLTNLFGQTVALVVMAAAISWELAPKKPISLAAFVALLTLAFCAHVSTVSTLIATLGVLVIAYWWRGDRSRRQAAITIVLSVAIALGISWLVFYRHFSDVFAAAINRVFTTVTPTTQEAAAAAARGYMSTSERLGDLFSQAVSSVAWPAVVLAAAGVWMLARRNVRDRLVCGLLAWATVWVVFSASTVFSKVDREFIRYTAEFLGRINLATIPVMAVLAARGATAGWDESTPPALRTPLRAAAAILVGWELWIAWNGIRGWFYR